MKRFGWTALLSVSDMGPSCFVAKPPAFVNFTIAASMVEKFVHLHWALGRAHTQRSKTTRHPWNYPIKPLPNLKTVRHFSAASKSDTCFRVVFRALLTRWYDHVDTAIHAKRSHPTSDHALCNSKFPLEVLEESRGDLMKLSDVKNVDTTGCTADLFLPLMSATDGANEVLAWCPQLSLSNCNGRNQRLLDFAPSLRT